MISAHAHAFHSRNSLQALRHSKVKLSWDEDNPERHQVTRRQLTRQEIEEADFRAYIASCSSDDESEGDNEGSLKNSDKSKDTSQQKLRALLLGGNDETMPEGWDDGGKGHDVDMEITFAPGLSEKKEEGTTLEKYQKKIREKRKKRKEEQKAVNKTKEGEKNSKGSIDGDEFFEFEAGIEEESEQDVEQSISNRRGKKYRRQISRKETTANELALLASSQNVNGEPKHFNMKAVLKEEKQKGKKGKIYAAENELQEDFTIDVNDDRFQVLHDDYQYAIDPTNPQ